MTATPGDESLARRTLRRLVTPHWILLLALLASATVWSIPWTDAVHRGFERREEITSGALLGLVGWYGVALVAAAAGFHLGRRIPPVKTLDAFPDDLYIRYFTALAAVGLAWSYGSVVVADPNLIGDALRNRTFNEFREAVGTESGLSTLRYAAILSGGFALYNAFFRLRLGALDVLNIVLLLAAAALGSRLSLVMAALVVVGLWTRGGAQGRFRAARALALVAALALAATAVNYIRNANYYETFYDTSNPLVMSAYSAISYLGAPFQASVGVAKMASREPDDVRVEAARRGRVPNELSNPGGDVDAVGWGTATRGPGAAAPPTVSRDPAVVDAGPGAVMAEWRNTTRRTEQLYLLSTRASAPQAVQRTEWYVRAEVSGRASSARPIRLVVVPIGQNGGSEPPAPASTRLRPVGNGIEKSDDANRYPLEAVYTAEQGVQAIRVGVAQDVPPGETARIVVDEAVAARVPADEISLFPSPWRPIARYLVPTYVPADFSDVMAHEEVYRRYVDVESGLQTNSALSTMYLSLGPLAFGLLGLVCFGAAMVAGHASLYRSLAFVALVAIAYAYAELWRIYLFNRGLIHFLVLSVFLVPFAHRGLRRGLRAGGFDRIRTPWSSAS